MRRGEIMNLRIKDLDILCQKINLGTTKNDEPRSIPLRGLAFKLISEICHQRKDGNPTDLLFPSPTTPLKPYDIETAWQACLKIANVKGFRFHDNRRTNASIHAAQGRTLLEIGQSLGHKSSQTTKRYAHLTYDHTAKIIEELDRQIFGETHDKQQ